MNGYNGSMVFGINNAEQMRLTSTGLGIGTSSPDVSGWGRAVRLQGASNAAYEVTDGTVVTQLIAAAGAFGIVGTQTNHPLLFRTNNTERARITSGGELMVNTSSVIGGVTANLSLSSTDLQNVNCSVMKNGTNNTGGAYIRFINYLDATIGSITQSTSTAVLYNVTSDQRLKENIQDADSASSLIDSLQVRKFDWKSDSTHQRYGFVAQELVTVAPEAVHQPTDTEEMMAVDYSKLVPMLVKEIQSLRVRVAQLETN